MVWVGVLSRLSSEGLAAAAQAAARRLEDPRVRHYLDPDYKLASPYASRLPALGLPEDEQSWDVYFVFAPGTRWVNGPPSPAYWMHQLRTAPPGHRLDAEALASLLRALLATPP